MTTKQQQTERDEAIATLHENIKPGDTVFTILRHVSRSGMSRSISPVIQSDGKPWDITYLVSRATGDKVDQTNYGVKIGGAGMDMGFALVYNLSRTMFRDGFECIGEGCPANDHSNKPHPPRVAGSMTHKDGGYALKQSWL